MADAISSTNLGAFINAMMAAKSQDEFSHLEGILRGLARQCEPPRRQGVYALIRSSRKFFVLRQERLGAGA